MIVTDKPEDDLVIITKCNGCGCTLMIFNEDLIVTRERHDDMPIPMIIEEHYATCPRCGEIVSHETNTKFEEVE